MMHRSAHRPQSLRRLRPQRRKSAGTAAAAVPAAGGSFALRRLCLTIFTDLGCVSSSFALTRGT